MEFATERRLEWKRLLTGHPLQCGSLPSHLQELLLKLDEKLGIQVKDPGGVAARHTPDLKERIIPPAGLHARPDLIQSRPDAWERNVTGPGQRRSQHAT